MYGHDAARWRGWMPEDPTPLEIDAAVEKLLTTRMAGDRRRRSRPANDRHVHLPIFDEVTLEKVA
jgi:hypothetical protein